MSLQVNINISSASRGGGAGDAARGGLLLNHVTALRAERCPLRTLHPSQDAPLRRRGVTPQPAAQVTTPSVLIRSAVHASCCLPTARSRFRTRALPFQTRALPLMLPLSHHATSSSGDEACDAAVQAGGRLDRAVRFGRVAMDGRLVT